MKWGDKVPRKLKLRLIGRKISNKDRRNIINKYLKIDQEDTFLPPVCPKCGGLQSYTIDHEAEYPERWIETFCLRDHELIAYTDNSPWINVIDNLRTN